MTQKVDWELPPVEVDVAKFERHIRGLGFSESTIIDYASRARRYLNACDTAEPTEMDAVRYRDGY